ncbi:MAG: TVP38/TMEM64 family protein [Coriobacteriales bacterium]|jgi:uncharacterized membrane protein YdjX (TVP38/TMEM64 family)|nr:TVP38/TMEM64 family protein [Coriobacteriales bacterium]
MSDQSETPNEETLHNETLDGGTLDGGTPPEKKRITTADKIKFAGFLAFVVLIVVAGIAIMPYFENFTSDEGRRELVGMIQNAGAFGVLICLGLQFLQVIVAFIPGEVTQLAIGAIYGPVAGTLVTALGALVSSIFVFFVVRRLGTPFVHAMINKKHADKLRFLGESRRLDTIVFVLFLIPGLPKDLFTYLVPLTNMRAVNFFLLSTLGRLPGIAASAFIGDAFLQGNYMGAIVVSCIAGGLGILGIVFNGKILKLVEKVEGRFKKPKHGQQER